MFFALRLFAGKHHELLNDGNVKSKQEVCPYHHTPEFYCNFYGHSRIILHAVLGLPIPAIIFLCTTPILAHNSKQGSSHYKEIKDQNFNESLQSSSDFTDNQTTTNSCLLLLHNPFYIYYKVR